MRILLPWAELQDGIGVRFDQALASTALANKCFNFAPQGTQLPFLFFGEFESDDSIADKHLASIVTFASFQVFSGADGNHECVSLVGASLAALTATPLTITSTNFKIIGPALLKDNVTLTQEYDGVGIVWVGRYRLAFYTQRIS